MGWLAKHGSAAGALERDPLGEHDRDAAGPRPAADGHDRRHPRRATCSPTVSTCSPTPGAYPAARRVPAAASPGRWRLAVYDIPRVESRARVVATTTTSTGAYRGAGRPEATAAIERAMDLFAAEIGMDPAEVRRRNLIAARRVPVHDQGRRHLRQRRVRQGPRPGARRRGLRGAARRAGRPPGARRPRPARHRRLGVRRDHRRRRVRRGRHGRGAPGRHGHRAHRHLAARAGPRDGLGDARQRAPRHPGREDHRQARRHRPRPARRAARWARAACRPAASRCTRPRRAGRDGQAARGRPAGGRVDDLEVADGAVRVRGTDVAVTLGRARRAEQLRVDSDVRQRRALVPVRRAPGRRRGRRRVRQGGRRPDRHRRRRRARCSTRCSPRASATAGSPRASRRRCSRRSSSTPTATR